MKVKKVTDKCPKHGLTIFLLFFIEDRVEPMCRKCIKEMEATG